MPAQAVVTGLGNPQATSTGFLVDVQFAVQDSALGTHTVDIVGSLPLAGGAATWKNQIVNAIIDRSILLGYLDLVAAKVNVPAYTTG